MLTEYFDQYEFDAPTIKTQINTDIYLTLTPLLSNNYYYKVSENIVEL